MKKTQGREIWGRATKSVSYECFFSLGGRRLTCGGCDEQREQQQRPPKGCHRGGERSARCLWGCFPGIQSLQGPPWESNERASEWVCVVLEEPLSRLLHHGWLRQTFTSWPSDVSGLRRSVLVRQHRWRDPPHSAAVCSRRLLKDGIWAQSFNCRLSQGAKCGNLSLLNESRSWPPPPVSHLEACCKGEKRKETFILP